MWFAVRNQPPTASPNHSPPPPSTPHFFPSCIADDLPPRPSTSEVTNGLAVLEYVKKSRKLAAMVACGPLMGGGGGAGAGGAKAGGGSQWLASVRGTGAGCRTRCPSGTALALCVQGFLFVSRAWWYERPAAVASGVLCAAAPSVSWRYFAPVPTPDRSPSPLSLCPPFSRRSSPTTHRRSSPKQPRA